MTKRKTETKAKTTPPRSSPAPALSRETVMSISDPIVDNAWHAVYSIESRHHIHGTQCLCGFQSHKARDRTKHIVRIALAEFLGSDVAEGVERLERGE